MAYSLFAEKQGVPNIDALRDRLVCFDLLEFFPIEVSTSSLSLGVSIPMKAIDEPGFAQQLEAALGVLITQEEFEVVDLYTGKQVLRDEIPSLAAKIAAE